MTPCTLYSLHLEEDADAEVHEGLGEVDDALPSVVDGHGAHGEVSFLKANEKVMNRYGRSNQ